MRHVNAPPPDLDQTRAAIAANDLTADASAFITYEVAVHVPFEQLGEFKTLLKRFFSTEPWGAEEAAALSDIVTSAIADGWWEHRLDGGIAMAHGVRDGRYVIWVSGGTPSATASLFDRVFAGPITPEPTPHPRKVKFTLGGDPGPGTWHRRTDGDPQDPRVARLFAEPDITDVMVAGDFITIGLERSSSWETRLDPLLALVGSLFGGDGAIVASPRSREDLLVEAGRVHLDVRPSALHLLDPDAPADRDRLIEALRSDDARLRRIAVAILAESSDVAVRHDAVEQGFADESPMVRRAAIDAAADTQDEAQRELFERALASQDAWVRWKAVRSLGELGVGRSRDAVALLEHDPDFQVRFEVARALRL
jgi:hypothetical protein